MDVPRQYCEVLKAFQNIYHTIQSIIMALGSADSSGHSHVFKRAKMDQNYSNK